MYGIDAAHKSVTSVKLNLLWGTGVKVNRSYFKMTAFWDMTQDNLVDGYQHFGETSFKHFQPTLRCVHQKFEDVYDSSENYTQNCANINYDYS
jgi:hypothetical protein